MQPLQLGGGEEWLSAQWDGSANAIRWTSTWHAGGLARRPVWPEQDEQRGESSRVSVELGRE